MKKLFFILCAIFMFQSCANKDQQLKKDIVGKYSYTQTKEDEEEGISTIISVNGTCTFNSDGSYKDNAILIVTYIDEDGDRTKIKYNLEMDGMYDVKDSYVVYDIDLKNINITLIQSDDYDISDMLNEHYIPQMKHEMVIDNKEKILELTEKYLKTESDGEITTYVRLSKPSSEKVSSSTEPNKENKKTTNNLITKTSIAGVEIIGKTIREVKSQFSPDLTWEDDYYEGWYVSIVKSGETSLYSFFADEKGIIQRASIWNTALTTTDGLHIGSTSGDILDKYPNAMVNGELDDDGNWSEYAEINGINYYFNSDSEKSVGTYSQNEISKIINKNIKISGIEIKG